jgi:endonuclease/exonuclease/phosphatase family metal-dependent hydrolase
MHEAIAAFPARIMTYNVHGFIGTDGVSDPERVASVIEQAQADLVALQEVDFPGATPKRHASFEWLAARLGMRCHFTLTRRGSEGGDFGNAVLSRHAFELVSEATLPRRGGETRAVQWLKVRSPGGDFHLMNTHLSPWFWERQAQVRALVGTEWMIRAGTALPLVVCGDFNATPVSPVYRHLARSLRDAQRTSKRFAPTWPAQCPFLRIDHLFVSSDLAVVACAVARDATSRRASDHLPVVADVELRTAAPARTGAAAHAAARQGIAS